MSDVAPPVPASARRPVLARRGFVSAYEDGERPLPGPDAVLRFGRPLLLPLTSLACVTTTAKVVALTYDDGPDPEHTPAVLAALAAASATATFFVLVEAAEKHPQLLRRIVTEGHEVGLHGIDHRRLAPVPAREVTTLIRDGKQRLERVLGQRVTTFRPTYGAQSIGGFLAARRLGMDVVVWSAWARDWEGQPADVISKRALDALHPGGFVLLHDASGDGVGAAGLDRGEATRQLLAGMAERGYTSRTVSDLVNAYPSVRTVWLERGGGKEGF